MSVWCDVHVYSPISLAHAHKIITTRPRKKKKKKKKRNIKRKKNMQLKIRESTHGGIMGRCFGLGLCAHKMFPSMEGWIEELGGWIEELMMMMRRRM